MVARVAEAAGPSLVVIRPSKGGTPVSLPDITVRSTQSSASLVANQNLVTRGFFSRHLIPLAVVRHPFSDRG
jgi:hypothetical protein